VFNTKQEYQTFTDGQEEPHQFQSLYIEGQGHHFHIHKNLVHASIFSWLVADWSIENMSPVVTQYMMTLNVSA
jgi:hypothetical protein